MLTSVHGLTHPSEWIQRYAALIAPGGTVLDVACGAGRHMKLLSEMGLRCLGVDQSASALEHARPHGEVLCADIESGTWPLPGRRFDAVVVTHYLWRPLMPTLVESLADGGVLLYETFAVGQETVGKPSRPEFLLRQGELLDLSRQHGLTVVAFEDVWLDHPRRRLQRLVAIR
ncbi:MAG: class I SAM-dependent methyltransferase [Alphaproteobacteria bacterium]|nr:class I SAM-dependent methyltransferase [Alphaproteobacteria bacterium]